MQATRASARAPRKAVTDRDLVAVVLAAAVALLVSLPAVRDPARVERLTITNPTPWELHAALGRSVNGPRAPLPVLRAGSTVEVPAVLDRGNRWVVHLSSAGRELEPVVVDRRRLVDDGWRLRLPDRVADALREAGVPPTPP